nr:MAG TPA: hypothetical protein [Caudoviricetes sp.]
MHSISINITYSFINISRCYLVVLCSLFFMILIILKINLLRSLYISSSCISCNSFI